MKKIYFITVLSILSATLFGEEKPQVAPLNPDFIRYQNQKVLGKRTPEYSSEGYLLGEVPPPFLPSFAGFSSGSFDQAVITDLVYDMRTAGTGGTSLVTSVKDQGNCGSCWTFATMGSIESKWKINGLGDFDLSEENLNNCHGFELDPCEGGNIEMAMAYFTRRSGPILELESTYTASEGTCPTEFHEVSYIPDLRQLPNVMNTIKQALIDYGALYTNMRWESSAYNRNDFTYCYSGSADSSTNHAVLIVGWDDTKVTTGGNGAWIIRNSWGPIFGENGYFYLSYNDTKANSSVGYFPTRLDYNSSVRVLGYDDLGNTSSVGYGGISGAGLVRLITNGPFVLSKIGTWVTGANAYIKIDIYDDFDGSTLKDDDLIGSISYQTCKLPGYYMFDLPTPISFKKTSDFYVKVKYQTGSYNYPIPVESISEGYSNPTIETGKCWISPSGSTWTKIGTGTESVYDLCIKAYGAVPPISVASPLAGETWPTGYVRNIEWTSENITNVKIEYSVDNGTTWLSVVASTPAVNGVYEWTVADDASATCLIRISDASNANVSAVSSEFTIFSYPQEFRASKTISFGNADNTTNYKIIGMPGADLVAISKFLDGKSPRDWNACWDDGDSANYQIEYDGSETFKFQPGRAFWILGRSAMKIAKEVTAVQLTSDLTYSIPLHDGWNLISNPFQKSVNWTDVQSENGIASNAVIYGWNGSWSQPSTFDPYVGYYFYNQNNLTELKIPFNVSAALAKTVSLPVIAEKHLELTLIDNEEELSSVFIGEDASAKDGLDEKDYFCPPAAFEKVRMFIDKPELSTQYRSFSVEHRSAIR
ncbi:MAG: C1 family peptidase, partial [Candidatus Neomarinimicrobiota bacterium]